VIDQYLKVFQVPKAMLLSDDFVIWLIQFSDLWICSDELGLTAPITVELLGPQNLHTRSDGYKVRAVEIHLTRADDARVMARFNSRCDSRETPMQYTIDIIFHFWAKADALVPSWKAADFREWIQKDANRELQQRLGVGVGVGGDRGSWLTDLCSNGGAGGAGGEEGSEQQTEDDIQAMWEGIDRNAGPDELESNEAVFMNSERWWKMWGPSGWSAYTRSRRGLLLGRCEKALREPAKPSGRHSRQGGGVGMML
jgi:hypothetical protein